MSSQAAGRRRSNNIRQYSAEDEALNMISKEAESRLAAKRAARAEARGIRMKEMEKQQKNTEEKSDRIYELTNEHAAAKIRQQISGSRRGSVESNDSMEGKDVDFKAEIRELEDKYKAAMMTSAQLDNEKQSLVYQVELLKDQLEEQDEGYTELQREYKDKCREFELQKRDMKTMAHELSILKQQLELKDRLIQESGFVIMANDRGEPVLEKQSSSPSASSSNGPLPTGVFLVSPETKEFLERAGDGTLGTPVVSNITDINKSVMSHGISCSDELARHVNPGSSKRPLTTATGIEDKMVEVSDREGEKVCATMKSSERSDGAEEELHDDVVDGKSNVIDVVAYSKHADGNNSVSQSKKPPEGEGQEIGAENIIENKVSTHRSSSGCASIPSVSSVGNDDAVRGRESDENGDEFFDSVTSPIEKTSPPIPLASASTNGSGVGESNISSRQDLSKRALINIDNVTTTDTSTDDLCEGTAGTPFLTPDNLIGGNQEIVGDIQDQRIFKENSNVDAADNETIICASPKDVMEEIGIDIVALGCKGESTGKDEGIPAHSLEHDNLEGITSTKDDDNILTDADRGDSSNLPNKTREIKENETSSAGRGEEELNTVKISPHDKGDSKKELIDRTFSFGGESQCSEGAIRAGYDLDDINDIQSLQHDVDSKTSPSDKTGEIEENPESKDNTVLDNESNNAIKTSTMDSSREEEGNESPDPTVSLEAVSAQGDQACADVKYQNPPEADDLEQTLDKKMKEHSKKKSKRFKLFKKVFK